MTPQAAPNAASVAAGPAADARSRPERDDLSGEGAIM